MNKLYFYCMMRWESGEWGEEELSIAVSKGHITKNEKENIISTQQ
ncbi:hypothetical protein SMD22_20650 [Brevibacillus halotolerans]|nr:hypothetical protein SMD22_20650 [Brevibacillus halotolerans]